MGSEARFENDDIGLLGAATGALQPIRLVVRDPDGSHEIEMRSPFAIVGRGNDCDIRIKADSVSYRHLYLQTLAGGLFFVALSSRTGVKRQGEATPAGWLNVGDVIQLGPYSVERPPGTEPAETAPAAVPADLNPLEQMSPLSEDFPAVKLEFMNPSIQQPAWTVNRMLTLVGRGPRCKLRLDATNVSNVHCSLVFTKGGLWVVDLLGKGGTRVDQKQVRCARLQEGRLLGIGDYRIRVREESGGAPPPAAADAAGDDTHRDDNASDDNSEDSARMADSFGFESLLNVERRDELMILAPCVEGGAFRYSQLRTASNAVRRLLDELGVRQLIIDLERLNYFGAEFIGVLITLARKVSNDGGQVVLCNAGPELKEMLENMNLFGLWPHFSSREEALQFLRK